MTRSISIPDLIDRLRRKPGVWLDCSIVGMSVLESTPLIKEAAKGAGFVIEFNGDPSSPTYGYIRRKK